MRPIPPWVIEDLEALDGERLRVQERHQAERELQAQAHKVERSWRYPYPELVVCGLCEIGEPCKHLLPGQSRLRITITLDDGSQLWHDMVRKELDLEVAAEVAYMTKKLCAGLGVPVEVSTFPPVRRTCSSGTALASEAMPTPPVQGVTHGLDLSAEWRFQCRGRR